MEHVSYYNIKSLKKARHNPFSEKMNFWINRRERERESEREKDREKETEWERGWV